MPPIRPTSRRRLWSQFAVGLLYLALVALFIRSAIDRHYLAVFAAVIGATVLCSGLTLAWLTLWAMRKDGRLGQFGVGSLLFLTAFAAVFLGGVRWIVTEIEISAVNFEPGNRLFLSVAIYCLVALVIGIPLVVRMTESTVWFAAWAVRRPLIRRLLNRRRSGRPRK